MNVIYQVARFYFLSYGYLVGNMPHCTWYAHVTFVMATVPESVFQSSNLIGLVRSVVRATTHMRIYNVDGIIYIYIYLITRVSMQYRELLHEWAWYFHEPYVSENAAHE